MSTVELAERWSALWGRLGAAGDGAAVFRELTRGYSEVGRAYHNLTHLRECLEEWSRVEEAVDREKIAFALWFHDFVYDTKAKDNEERSAAIACEVASKAGLGRTFVEDVSRLILATKHAAGPQLLDEQVVVDIDLSILGKDPVRFDEHERQIREEYSWVPEDQFVVGRLSILKSFADRPRIYSTERMYVKYEGKARRNLEISVRRLEARSLSGGYDGR